MGEFNSLPKVVLSIFFEELKKVPQSDQILSSFIEELQELTNFQTFRPLFEAEFYDEDVIQSYNENNTKSATLISDVYHEELTEDNEYSDFIADDIFALILNIDGELAIDKEIYRYTPFGLFITVDDDCAASQFEDIITDYDKLNQLIRLNQAEGVDHIEIDSGVKYYRPKFTELVNLAQDPKETISSAPKALDFRVFYGASSKWHTPENQSSGLYIGSKITYWSINPEGFEDISLLVLEEFRKK